jgi:hypothetical protein
MTIIIKVSNSNYKFHIGHLKELSPVFKKRFAWLHETYHYDALWKSIQYWINSKRF